MMRLVTALSVTMFLTPAPQDPTPPKPEKEHEWLQQLAGDWETEAEVSMEPGKDPVKSKGTAGARMVGAYWIMIEHKGEIVGHAFTGILTAGYDAEKKKYVGTWLSSMEPRLWHYVGAVDGATLALHAEGPNPSLGGKLTKFRDAIEVKGKDELVMTSAMEQDGKWAQFLVVRYTRKK